MLGKPCDCSNCAFGSAERYRIKLHGPERSEGHVSFNVVVRPASAAVRNRAYAKARATITSPPGNTQRRRFLPRLGPSNDLKVPSKPYVRKRIVRLWQSIHQDAGFNPPGQRCIARWQ
jgi:hypothetical protein